MLRRGATTYDIMVKLCPTSVLCVEVKDVLVLVSSCHGPGIHSREDDKHSETTNSNQGINLGNMVAGVTRDTMLLQYPYPRKQIRLFKCIPSYSGAQ